MNTAAPVLESASLTFEEMLAPAPLSKETLKALRAQQLTHPTPIQAEAIPHLLEGHDVLGQAQTGTGKTLAFVIPLLEKIDPSNKRVQAVVLCPTRELALQVHQVVQQFTRFRPQVSAVAVYGGQPIERQFAQLNRGAHLVIGTPGRVLDHIRRGSLLLNNVETVVLDEADEMLNMGFRPDIESILNEMPSNRQTVLFSATMAMPILKLTSQYQRFPKQVTIANQKATLPPIQQFYLELDSTQKVSTVHSLCQKHRFYQGLIFCNTQRRVDSVVKQLNGKGLRVDGLHGGMTQSRRNRVMKDFRSGKTQYLVATDVAARGLDVAHVDVVFNFELHRDTESYIHRIGRTGRAGKAGTSFALVESKERWIFRSLQRLPNVTMTLYTGEVDAPPACQASASDAQSGQSVPSAPKTREFKPKSGGPRPERRSTSKPERRTASHNTQKPISSEKLASAANEEHDSRSAQSSDGLSGRSSFRKKPRPLAKTPPHKRRSGSSRNSQPVREVKPRNGKPRSSQDAGASLQFPATLEDALKVYQDEKQQKKQHKANTNTQAKTRTGPEAKSAKSKPTDLHSEVLYELTGDDTGREPAWFEGFKTRKKSKSPKGAGFKKKKRTKPGAKSAKTTKGPTPPKPPKSQAPSKGPKAKGARSGASASRKSKAKNS